MVRQKERASSVAQRKLRAARQRARGLLDRSIQPELLEGRSYLAAHIVGDPTSYSTIQAAVSAATSGATINVDAGTYSELVTISKPLTINGAQAGVDARSNLRRSSVESIVNGTTTSDGKTSGFYINASGVTIDGFTVQGNTSSAKYGAGIVIAPGKSGTHIFNNIVQNNVAGMYLANASSSDAAVIQYNVFRNNNNSGTNSGRGIYSDGDIAGGKLTNVTIDNNAFFNNHASTNFESGVGLESRYSTNGAAQTNIRVTNNVFDNNGKAVLSYNISNLTISGNSVTHEVDSGSGAFRFEGGAVNVIITGNSVYNTTSCAVRVDSKAWSVVSSGFVVTNNNFFGNFTSTGSKESVNIGTGQYSGTFDARNNWWGNASGPGGVSSGTGDILTANGNSVLFSPWLSAPTASLQEPYWGTPAVITSTIEAEDYDFGYEGVGYHDSDKTNSGGVYRSDGVDLVATTDASGAYQVNDTKPGEWLAYTVNIPQSGSYTLLVRVATSQSTGGKFHLEVDGANVTGSISVPGTGGSWQTLTLPGVNLSAGTRAMRLVMDTGGSSGTVGNFNWLKFTANSVSNVPAAPTVLAAQGTTPNTIALNWRDNSGNETGFIIERTGGGSSVWTTIATTGANITTYTDATVAPGTTYTYRVRATSAAGDSDNSNQATASTPAISAVTYLSDLAWLSATNGWGPVEKDMSNGGNATGDGNPLTLNGIKYAKGLGVHAASDITYALNGNYTSFLADVGVDDEEGASGSVDFQVFADGVKIYDSGVLTGNSATGNINVNVTGVNQLRLVVTDGGDGIDFDHGDWAGARLTTANVVPTAPAVPTSLAASALSNTQVKLTWQDNATNELGYKIERSTDGVTFVQIGTTAADANTYIDLTATSLTAYSYRVRAAGNSGLDSDYSNVASVTTPAAPTFAYLSDLAWVSATNGWGPVERDTSNGSSGAGDGKTMTLNGVTYAKGLGVHAASEVIYNLNGAYSQFLSDIGVDDESAQGTVVFQVYADNVKVYDSGLMTATSATKQVSLSVAGKQQLKLVVTDSGDGNSYDKADWAGARLVFAEPAPAAPTGLTATLANGVGPVNLAWTDKATNETGIRVERSTDGVNFTTIATLPAGATSYSDSALAQGVTYTYRAVAFNSTGSGTSNTASVSVPVVAPTAPANLVATALNGTVSLTWTAGGGTVQGNYLERADDGVTFTRIATLGAVTSFTDTTAVVGTSYTYRVQAFNATGPSDYSATATATVPPAPAAPTALTALVNGAVISLTWTDNASNETGFRVERSTDNVTFTALTTLAANATSYSDAALVQGQTYYYRVVAFNTGGGASAYTNVASALAPIQPPAAPTGLSATVAGAAISLGWVDNSTNEDGYRVERSTDDLTYTTLASLPKASTTYSDTTAVPGQIYYYRVQAYNLGGASAYTATVNATVPNTALPLGWTSQDIGNTGATGSATQTNGVFTVAGAGNQIGTKADVFQYASTTMTGDVTIVSRVTSITKTDNNALAGIMIRESNATGSKEVGIYLSAANGLFFLRRSTTGGDTTTTNIKGFTAPVWLKLTRKGDVFTAYSSTDGVTWSTVGSATVSMTPQVMVGLAVTSHKPGVLNTSKFDNVSVIQGVLV
jgi:titin